MELAIQDTNISHIILNEVIQSCVKLKYQPNLFGFIEDDISPTHEITQPTIMLGGTKLLKLHLENKISNFCVLFYDKLKFDQRYYSTFLDEELVNCNAKFTKWNKIKNTIPSKSLFIKPSSDMKIFSGNVLNPNNQTVFELLKDCTTFDSALNDDTNILINYDLVKIEREFRAFVIYSEVVDISQYMIDSKVIVDKIDSLLYNDLVDYIKFIQTIYEPYHSYVIDVGIVDNKFKVVEYNCLNISGMYANDRTKIYKRLLEL